MEHSFQAGVRAAAFGSALVLLSLPCGAAPSYPKEGNFDYTACYSGTSTVLQTSKTNSATANRFAGNTRSNPPGGAFDLLSFTCVSMATSVDAKVSNSYVCQVSDVDGDKFLTRGVFDGTKTTTDAYGGTGKFEGMVRVGTSTSVGAFPAMDQGAFTGCTHHLGTYKRK